MPKTLSRLLSQFHCKGRMARGRHSQWRREKGRNIWKISALQSLLKSDLTTKRLTLCILLKVMVNYMVPSAMHSGSGAAKMHTSPSVTSNFQRRLVIILNPEKCSLTSKKRHSGSFPRLHSGSPPSRTNITCPCPPSRQPKCPQMATRTLRGP